MSTSSDAFEIEMLFYVSDTVVQSMPKESFTEDNKKCGSFFVETESVCTEKTAVKAL